MTIPTTWSPSDETAVRLVIATYILGQMINTKVHASNGDEAKEKKVKAAFEYADLLLKG